MARGRDTELWDCEAVGSRALQGGPEELLQGAAPSVSAGMSIHGLQTRRVHGWVHVPDDGVQRVQFDALLRLLRMNGLELPAHPLCLLFLACELGKKRRGAALRLRQRASYRCTLVEEVLQVRRRPRTPGLCGFACVHDTDVKRPKKEKSRPRQPRERLFQGVRAASWSSAA